MRQKWWTLVVVCAATFMLLLDVTIVTVALPDIQGALHATFAGVQWVLDAYALTLASLLLTAGSLADRYGRKRLFLIGLTIFTLGSLLCGVALTPLMLIISRSVQGVGGAILFSTSLALLAHSFHGRERGVAFGVWGAVTGVSVALGPILGGVITTGISWRGIFLVNLPIGIAAIAATFREVEESRTPGAARPDWAGFVSLTAGLVGIVYGLIRASETSWGDTGVALSLIIGAVILAGFVAIERRAPHPMFDLSLFRIPTFLGGSVAALTMNGSLFAMFIYIVLYLQYDLGYSALASGLRLLPISGATLIAATAAGRLSARVPVRLLIGPGLGLVGVGMLLMARLDADSDWTRLLLGFIIAGFGAGMVNPPLASTAVGVVLPHRAGMASGVNTTFRQVGIALSIAVFGTLFTTSLGHHLDDALRGTALAGHGGELVDALQRGDVGQAIGAAPADARGQLIGAVHSSFAHAMNELFVVGAVIALVGGVLSLVLIRRRDFVTYAPPGSAGDTTHTGDATPATSPQAG